MEAFIRKHSNNAKNDILSGMTVALALVPEAVAFAFVAGVDPLVGLYAAFMIGIITAIFGGRPGMISGATGALAVVMVSLVARGNAMGTDADNLGLYYLFATVILMGIIQMLAGFFKLGKFVRLIPHPVMMGFVNGLAIVIAMAQFKFFDGQGLSMYIIVTITMLIMYFLPKYTKAVPSGLVAIVLLTLIVYFANVNTLTVGALADLSEFKGKLPHLIIPETLLSMDAIVMVLPYAVIMALVGLIESLLTLAVLDEMSSTRGSGNQECIALGTGNITCGFFGGMAGCAMIGQSIIKSPCSILFELTIFLYQIKSISQ